MTRVFIDANVFLYAVGSEHPYRQACRAVISGLEDENNAAETSVEVLQEVWHVRRRRTANSREAVDRVRDILALQLPVHDLRKEDLELALELQLTRQTLSSRDAVHLATMRNRGIERILSADRDFDEFEGVVRVDPIDAAS